ncbi:STELLO glycosyltransferase family protein [Sporomusa sp.]|uniref:STELLO glycosyltransferase family protein n=1 Tax=Sporomusa sp. TaxID=2078658 RepID=UPI002BE2BB73|nr:STELLO glycosyltransferase family protein [Sporomusa sp.]HWR41609.1 STELLO glycosyltransferase family protein [Sporomusa sp.]
MQNKVAIVVTSISNPNKVLKSIASGAVEHGYEFIVVGDTKSPSDFYIEGCKYVGIEDQVKSGLEFAAVCPTRHYARKNIGYLLAIRDGAKVIIETDDDNMPRNSFFSKRERLRSVHTLANANWVNVYRYFSDKLIWPRGLPLDAVHNSLPALDALPSNTVDCPIQQGLADENPDVDAIYRLILPLPQLFLREREIALGKNSWCPFNSQNTTWWSDAFPLLYLPAYCSFRMTDIWRSFVAQRIAWENGWHILFHDATVWQERNEHDLMNDFVDEIPGYTHNRRIAETLGSLSLQAGHKHILDNMRKCYEALVGIGVVGHDELRLLNAWLSDLVQIGWLE